MRLPQRLKKAQRYADFEIPISVGCAPGTVRIDHARRDGVDLEELPGSDPAGFQAVAGQTAIYCRRQSRVVDELGRPGEREQRSAMAIDISGARAVETHQKPGRAAAVQVLEPDLEFEQDLA